MFTLNGKKLICILISFNHRLVRDIIYRHGYYIYSNGYHMLCWVYYTYSQGEPIYRQEDHKYSLVYHTYSIQLGIQYTQQGISFLQPWILYRYLKISYGWNLPGSTSLLAECHQIMCKEDVLLGSFFHRNAQILLHSFNERQCAKNM